MNSPIIKPFGTISLDASIYKSLSEKTKLIFQIVFPSTQKGIHIIDIFTSTKIKDVKIEGNKDPSGIIVEGYVNREWFQKKRRTITIRILFRPKSPDKATYLIVK